MVPGYLNSVGPPKVHPMVCPAHPPFILSIRTFFERVTVAGMATDFFSEAEGVHDSKMADSKAADKIRFFIFNCFS
ncbi:hypothetical protein AGMMS49574_14320 [Bacteroidia bacterium]|nr:hypothetical protein AGMMS49574_14320 [Bacteroidia bacterium]